MGIFETIHTIYKCSIESISRTDNLTYGIGKDTANNGQIPSLETGAYEVPVNMSTSAGTVTQDAKTEPEYEITESTYAIPHVYEYATLGPNEHKVNSSVISYS